MSIIDNAIKFFEEIPEENWTYGSLYIGDRCCAVGHLNKNCEFEFSREVFNLVFNHTRQSLASFNDAHPFGVEWCQDQLNIQLEPCKPKQNTINFLKGLKIWLEETKS